MAKNGKGRKARRIAVNVIIVCLMCIALFSGYKAYTVLKGYNDARNVYDEAEDIANAGKFTGDINFDALREINGDIEAWIYLEGTKINYPIVQAENNEKYLHTLFDGSYGGSGTIFTDARTMNPFRQYNTIVYGHHMKDKSMFYDLNKFRDYEFLKEHDRFELILPDGKYHLDVVAFLREDAECAIYKNNIEDDEEKDEYMDWIDSHAIYRTNLAVTHDDRLVILSTCAIEAVNDRYLVVGKMIEWEEDK